MPAFGQLEADDRIGSAIRQYAVACQYAVV